MSIEWFQSSGRLVEIKRVNISPTTQRHNTCWGSFIDNSTMDIFPMKNSVNLEIQMLGNPWFEMFQVEKNKIGSQWGHNSDSGKQSPMFVDILPG